MLDYRIILGVVATVIGFIGYLPYIRDVLRGKTKPHAFSWFVWGTLEAVAFVAQLTSGGGAGAWATGMSSAISFVIVVLAFREKDKQIKIFDWIALSGAFIGIALWRITNDPLLAVISVTIADALGFAPTFRKAFHKPQEETLIEYALSAVKWIIAIPALGALTLTTWLYPASLIVTNALFVTMVLIRRRQSHL